jgi:hypothetical protein
MMVRVPLFQRGLLKLIIWALDNGLEFEFDCSKVDPVKQPLPSYRKEDAILLWQWLHKESNRHRCTCSNAVVS